MKKVENYALLSSAILTVMSVAMTWVNLRYPENCGGPKFLMMLLLLVLWMETWLNRAFPETLHFLHNAAMQSVGVAMGFWIFAAGELLHRLRYIGGSAGDWSILCVFGIVFVLILSGTVTGTKTDE